MQGPSLQQLKPSMGTPSAKQRLIQKAQTDFGNAQRIATTISKKREDVVNTFLRQNEKVTNEIKTLLTDRHLISLIGHLKQVQLFSRCLSLLEQHTYELQKESQEFLDMIAYFKSIELQAYGYKTEVETALYSQCITTMTREKKVEQFITFTNQHAAQLNWLIDYTLRGTIIYTARYRGFEEEGKPKEY